MDEIARRDCRVLVSLLRKILIEFGLWLKMFVVLIFDVMCPLGAE